jgi:phosphoglycolate phosphatase
MEGNAGSGVLLDLDGTLLDTAPDLGGALNTLREERGLPALPAAGLRPLCSWGARGILRGGFGIGPDDPDYNGLRERFLALYRARLAETTAPFPGMREAVAELVGDGWAWGVVTNKFKSLAVPLMEAMAFEPPPACVIGGDSAAHAKPHPAPLLLACEIAGLAPATSIYVGDSARDIAAGKAAGMATIAAAYGYIEADDAAENWVADILIRDASELPAAVAKLSTRRPAISGSGFSRDSA